ncbi:MAG: YdcF family protein [Verrucomicrobia bacterium]|nr:YdcF family protein [Verrucomicrobiota bacterium]
MLFWLKKFVSFWLMPLPACLAILVVSLLLLQSKRLARLGRALAATAVVVLALLSNSFISKWLMRPLETRYPSIPELPAGAPVPPALAACRYVVVLGSGNGHNPGTAAVNLLGPSALSRLTEAVRVLRALPDARLIVSGPGDRDKPSHARVLSQAAQSLGIDAARILQVESARDTEEEAHAVVKLAGGAPLAVVTSAWHLPRAVALFRHAGVTVVPCPADFRAHPGDQLSIDDFLFDAESLVRSTYALRERIGYTWIWLRGLT